MTVAGTLASGTAAGARQRFEQERQPFCEPALRITGCEAHSETVDVARPHHLTGEVERLPTGCHGQGDFEWLAELEALVTLDARTPEAQVAYDRWQVAERGPVSRVADALDGAVEARLAAGVSAKVGGHERFLERSARSLRGVRPRGPSGRANRTGGDRAGTDPVEGPDGDPSGLRVGASVCGVEARKAKRRSRLS